MCEKSPLRTTTTLHFVRASSGVMKHGRDFFLPGVPAGGSCFVRCSAPYYLGSVRSAEDWIVDDPSFWSPKPMSFHVLVPVDPMQHANSCSVGLRL